jgi:hypothetical protein
MKQKVINAFYRKDSTKFPEWMKYEVTLLNEDGTEETIPAYGKDLQDALSRVVHDKNVVAVSKKVHRIPVIIWVALWFGYVTLLWGLTYTLSDYNKFNGLLFLGGMAIITLATLSAEKWFRMRNKSRDELN